MGPTPVLTTVALYAINRTVVAYLFKEGGARAWELCLLTKQVFRILDRWSITLRQAYLKGIANAGADSLSRGKEVLEWCFSPATAQLLAKTWWIPHCGLFTDSSNATAKKYFTLDRQDHRAQAVDTFLQDCSLLQGTLYAFPPPQLGPQVLSMVTQHKVDLVLITPCWEDVA